MLSVSDFVSLPYTHDLTEGGIACALHSLHRTYSRIGHSPYEHLRRMVAGAAVELAFRRYLGAQNIPFEVKGATPFTEPDRYDVALGGRRCNIKSFLITRRAQVSQLQSEPQILLRAPALVASDLHAANGQAAHDLYIFAFLSALVAISQEDLHKQAETGQPYYLVHGMPEAWNRPTKWIPLGPLVFKSEAEEPLTIEIGGQDEGRAMRSHSVELPPRTRVQFSSDLFSLSYIHAPANPGGRIGIYSPLRKQTHLIGVLDWGNIGVYGLHMLLAGFLTRDEFGRHASFLPAGSRVFQYDHTHVKNLAVPVSELRPLAELFERARAWSVQTGN